ncbi:hypothetical protein [Mesorhizobium sp. CAU 1741]|uniref:hypothetical protein n=1 Tax=Mesorhizobium sp. CAU 1741 TaxID=3140366 RepID=UPI00325AE269
MAALLETVMHKLWFDMAMLGMEAQQVFWLRTMKIAKGGKLGEREARLMVSEKVMAAGETAQSLALGASPGSVVKAYRKKVRANARRLSR